MPTPTTAPCRRRLGGGAGRKRGGFPVTLRALATVPGEVTQMDVRSVPASADEERRLPPGPRTPLLIPIGSAAAALSVSARHLSNLVSRGYVKTVRLGRRRMIPAAELQRLAEHGTEAP